MAEYDELLDMLDGYGETIADDAAAAIRAQSKRIAELEADANAWRLVAKRAGICMSCAVGSIEPCTDCLGTQWDGGAPAEFREPLSRLAAIYAYRGEAEKVAALIIDRHIRALSSNDPEYDEDDRLRKWVSSALLAARMEGAEAEREACEKICDEYGQIWAKKAFKNETDEGIAACEGASSAGYELAAAIRARKDTP